MVTREGGACCRRCREPVVARYQHWGRLSSDMWRCKAAVEEVDLSMLDSIPADERHAGMALRDTVGVVPVRACEHTCASTSASASESACAVACTGACVSCKLFTPVFLCKLKKPTVNLRSQRAHACSKHARKCSPSENLFPAASPTMRVEHPHAFIPSSSPKGMCCRVSRVCIMMHQCRCGVHARVHCMRALY